jgi:hypothetical protein
MKRPKGEDGKEVDNDERALVNNKANYSKHGTEVNLAWQMNRFVCTDPPITADSNIGKADKAERVFMKLFRWHAERGIDMSPGTRSPQFPPTLFNSHPNREGVNLTGFKRALATMLDNNTIRIVERRISGRMAKVLEVV